MNNRIEEIAKDAELNVDDDGEINSAFCGSANDRYCKFAELIIEECSQFTDKNSRVFLFKHFGIEQ
jgi:hypothetical protein